MDTAEPFLPTPIRAAERVGSRAVEGVRITEALHPADETRRPHAHADLTIAILLAGSFRESVNGHSADFVERGALLRCGGIVHGNRYGAGGARVLHMEVPRASDGMGRGDADPEWRGLGSLKVSLLGWALRGEMWHRDEASELACQSLVAELVDEVTGSGGRGRSERTGGATAPSWLSRAVEMLWDRACDAVTIQELADAVGVHRVTLARGFRAHVGTTPGDYLRRVRLARALPKLGLGHGSLADVALGAGFYDQSHLNRWVKREVGTTPGRLREGRPRSVGATDPPRRPGRGGRG